MHWNLGGRTFWTMLIIGMTCWVGQYTSDQVLVQRYLAAKDLKQARLAGWTSAFLCLPTWGFFFFLGTGLYAFYRVRPDAAVVGMPADNVFPHFILTQMPSGLKGLVIAGVLSAAMGSLSAALNAFATVATIDIVKPYLLPNRSDRYYTWTARLLTAFAAVLMFAIGIAFSVAHKESFVDLSQQINSLLGGVVPGFFLLGFFAAKVNTRVVWQAFIVGFCLNVYLVLVEWKVLPNLLGLNIHPYWVSTLVLTVMLVTALVLARLQGTHRECPNDLTVFPDSH